MKIGFQQVLKNFQHLKKCQCVTNSFKVFKIFSRSQYNSYETPNPFLTVFSVKLRKEKSNRQSEGKML